MSGPTSTDAAIEERRSRALLLHLQGATGAQIGRILNIGPTQVGKDLKAALATRVPKQTPLEAYQVEAARMDLILTSLAQLVKDGDSRSVELFMRASERRTELAGLIGAGTASREAEAKRTPLDELNARRATRGAARAKSGN